MFKNNDDHKQLNLFGFEDQFDEYRKKMLENGWPAVFYENVFSKIDEDTFSEMYSDKPSRPNFPINILISLEILKHLHNLTDQELIERFHFDLRYLKALGLQEIGKLTLGERTIYEFRDRIAVYLKENDNVLIDLFDTFLEEFIEKAGISTKIQRMDSSMVKANIKHLSRIQLVHKIAVNFIEVLPSHKQKKIHKNILKLFKKENFKDFVNKHSKEEVLENICGKLYDIKLRFKNDSELNETKEYKQLCRVLEDQAIISSQEIIVKKDTDIASDSLQNPADENASYRKKRNKSYQGYSVNISETASKGNPIQMITDVKIEPNIYSDINFLNTNLCGIKAKTDLEKLIVDGAYYGPDTKISSIKNDVEILPTALTGRNPKYSTANFKINHEKGVLYCPMNYSPIKSKYLENNDNYAAWFDKEDCESCNNLNNCPVVEQKKNMTVRFSGSRHQSDLLRAELKNPENEELKKLRPAVEGTFSALKRAYGLWKLKVRGLLKASQSVLYKCIAYNFNQLFRGLKTGLIDEHKHKLVTNS